MWRREESVPGSVYWKMISPADQQSTTLRTRDVSSAETTGAAPIRTQYSVIIDILTNQNTVFSNN